MNAELSTRPIHEPEEKSALCAAILRTLPEWFGIERANAEYIRQVRDMQFFAAYDCDKTIGFIALHENEIHVMGVLPEYHRRGAGRMLVARCEKHCLARGIPVMAVKTLGPAHPDEGYARTRAFYEGMGFEAVEVTEEWGSACPCLHMEKRLIPIPLPNAELNRIKEQRSVTMEKLKFVLIGCGRIATLHVAGYKNNPDGELWGVQDINKSCAEKFAMEHCVPKVYGSFDEVLADPEVAGVELLIPHHLHCEYTVKACNAGKHVAVQKPMAMNLQQCDEMIKAAKDNNVVLKVSENFIFYPPYRFAKKMLDDGEIGTPAGIRLKMNNAGLHSKNVPIDMKAKRGSVPEDEGLEKTGWAIDPKSWLWRFNQSLSGGGPTVFDDGYHKFSVVLYMLGAVEKVFAWIDKTQIIPGIYNDSPANVMWKHKGDRPLYGAWDIMQSDEMYVQSKYYTCDERVEITGSRGILWITRCTATLMPEVAPVIMYRDGKLTEFWDMKHDWADSFEASTRDFVDSVAHDHEPTLSGEQGREVLKFALAAVDSANQGKEIFLDDYEDKPVPKKKGLLGQMFARKK